MLSRAAAVLGLLGLLVLVPATLLSVLRLTQPGSGDAVRLVAFTPLGLPLHLVALVLLVLALLTRRGPSDSPRRRWGLRVGAMLAVVGLGLHGWWLSPGWLGDAPAAASGARPLVVMTANVFEGHGSPADLVDAVRRHDVDILVLVEIRTPLLEQADADGLSELLPHRAATPAWWERDAGTMVLSRTPLGQPVPVGTAHQSWLVEVDTADGPVRLLAAHPSAPTTIDQWRADHRLLRATIAAEHPDVVAGDLNATADHEPVQALVRDGYRDAAELVDAGWQPTWPALGGGLAVVPVPLVAIDHVLLASGWTALGTDTARIADTDHRALIARIAPT